MLGCAALADRLRRSTVQVVSGAGGGSGVVWDARGAVVTNAHVLQGEVSQVVDANGRRLRARVLKRDREGDLAVLETGAGDLAPAVIGDSAALRTGEIVIAIGHPFGVTGAIAAGMIHTVGPLDFAPRRHWIQADIRLAPGNSGGILADAEGRVIGINTMIFHGIGLAVPSNEVREFASGQPDRARLGVEMIGVRQGLMVVAIEPGSMADRAGILIGDVLRCWPDQLRRLLGEAQGRGSVKIPLLRGGRGLLVIALAWEAQAA
jgi:serine protease Do